MSYGYERTKFGEEYEALKAITRKGAVDQTPIYELTREMSDTIGRGRGESDLEMREHYGRIVTGTNNYSGRDFSIAQNLVPRATVESTPVIDMSDELEAEIGRARELHDKSNNTFLRRVFRGTDDVAPLLDRAIRLGEESLEDEFLMDKAINRLVNEQANARKITRNNRIKVAVISVGLALSLVGANVYNQSQEQYNEIYGPAIVQTYNELPGVIPQDPYADYGNGELADMEDAIIKSGYYDKMVENKMAAKEAYEQSGPTL